MSLAFPSYALRSLMQVLPSPPTDGHSTYSAVSVGCDTVPRGCSAGANSAMLTGMKTETPRPTLEQLRRGTPSILCTARPSRLCR